MLILSDLHFRHSIVCFCKVQLLTLWIVLCNFADPSRAQTATLFTKGSWKCKKHNGIPLIIKVCLLDCMLWTCYFSVLFLGDIKTRYHVNGWGTWSLHTNYCSSYVPCWSWGLSTTLLGSSICTYGARSHVSISSHCRLCVNVRQVVTSPYVGAFCSVNMYVCHSLFVRSSVSEIINLNSSLACSSYNRLFRSKNVFCRFSSFA